MRAAPAPRCSCGTTHPPPDALLALVELVQRDENPCARSDAGRRFGDPHAEERDPRGEEQRRCETARGAPSVLLSGVLWGPSMNGHEPRLEVRWVVQSPIVIGI